MSKKQIIFIFTILCFSYLTAESYSKPGKTSFIAVFSFDITPSPENEFLRSYLGMESFTMGQLPKRNSKNAGKIIYEVMAPAAQRSVFFGFFSGAAQETEKVLYTDTLNNEDNFITAKIYLPGNRISEFLGMKVTLYDTNLFYFVLPLNFKVEVPQDIKYVYFGHFNYKRKGGMGYDIIDIKRKDKFDEAEKEVKRRYGKEAELVRLPLLDMND